MMGVWPQGLMRNVVRRMMPANFCAVGHAQLACGLCRAVVADWRRKATNQVVCGVGVTRRAVDRIRRLDQNIWSALGSETMRSA